MNPQLPLEARVRAQEHRASNLEARVEDLSDDMMASFKQISEYLGKIEDGFDRVEKDITGMKGDIVDIRATMATKEDITHLEGEIADIRATMATKEDITHIQRDIVHIQRDVGSINGTIVTLTQHMLLMFNQILERLPKSEKEK